MTEEAKKAQNEQEPSLENKLQDFIGEENDETTDTFADEDYEDLDDDLSNQENEEVVDKDTVIDDLRRKLKAAESKNAVEEALAKYPEADKEDLIELAKKRRPRNEIFRIAKVQQNAALRKEKQLKAQLKDLTKIEQERFVQNVKDIKDDITGAWGSPHAGGTGDSAKPLTIVEFKKLSREEQIRRIDEVQRSDNTKI